MKYKVGDKVRIKNIDWYNENKNKYGNIICGYMPFTSKMSIYCGEVLTICDIKEEFSYYHMEEIDYDWTDEMIEGLAEEPVLSAPNITEGVFIHEKDMKQTTEYILPDGYQFKDEYGNVINATKIVLEKANTLKIQSDNMETETHRGYYTTEPETTSEGKKRSVVYFWDNDFADKVELDLSGRELIQEDGKWFVVKKKKEYPKTYDECCELLFPNSIALGKVLTSGYNCELLKKFGELLICRDTYWKIAGDEMGLEKPWEPDYDSGVNKYGIICMNGVIQKSNPTTNWERHLNKVFDFPTEEMRDAFKENFDKDLEFCKGLL